MGSTSRRPPPATGSNADASLYHLARVGRPIHLPLLRCDSHASRSRVSEPSSQAMSDRVIIAAITIFWLAAFIAVTWGWWKR